MISVLMGVHTYDEYVPQAIGSILSQSFKDFELIIIANGTACDDVENCVIRDFSNEKKVKVIKSHIGQLAHALNIGINASKYEYIARMDSDDVAWPDRLQRQLMYLNENRLDLVGCDLRLIDSSGKVIGTRVYPKGLKINRYLSFRNCFAHNTVLMRKSMLLDVRGYNSGFNSEDYDLWLRLRRFGVKWDNMNEVLLDYRIHDKASQRRLLGYAESTALAMREFVLKKTVSNFLAVGYHFLKSLLRARDK